MRRRTLRYPTCTKCCYNLTGIDIVDNRYTCPECGTSVGYAEAMTAPYYIGRYSRQILIGALPPIGLLNLGMVPIFVASDIESRAARATGFVLFSLFTLIWPFLVGLHYAIKVRRWNGPNDWGGPVSAFMNVFFRGLGLLGAGLIPLWILAFMIFAGSTF